MKKEHVLKIRDVNRDIFNAIKNGEKRVETRAAIESYRGIKKGDVIVFTCGKSRFRKTVKKVELFRTIGAILKRYEPQQINSKTRTAKEARDIWYSFPNYKEKIKKYGLIAWELK